MAARLKNLAKRLQQRCLSLLHHRAPTFRMTQPDATADKPIGKRALKSLYNYFYFRDPDLMANLLLRNTTMYDVLNHILASSEFKHNLPLFLSRVRASQFNPKLIENRSLFQANTARYSHRMRDLIKQHTFGGEYRDYHFNRFVEQHSLITCLNQKRVIKRILDISFMPFTSGIYKHYIDGVEVCTVDLPSSMGGPSKQLLDSFDIDEHWDVDLNGADLEDLSSKITQQGFFDLVIATEVIEHLQVDFSVICKFMVTCAGTDGLCFVTTPNYLSSENMRQIAAGKSPQQRFLNFNANRGGHYHFREYTMHELEEIITDLGFHVLWNMYSDCWEDSEDSGQRCVAECFHAGAEDTMRNMAILFAPRKGALFDTGESLG